MSFWAQVTANVIWQQRSAPIGVLS